MCEKCGGEGRYYEQVEFRLWKETPCLCDFSIKMRELRAKWEKADTEGKKIKIELQMSIERIENKKQLEARGQL
ncbi:hypothetical protein J6TS1_19870 [Siminovitchia terrae]|uniref:Uncharacterized protein n=1 Tax=Siminovitchia terrae TaxID=1914933 RepID=A0ABQ4KWT3_SIMTE|nr:hypothetical protein J6TS1_19870 [Siminovitchia terrae]